MGFLGLGRRNKASNQPKSLANYDRLVTLDDPALKQFILAEQAKKFSQMTALVLAQARIGAKIAHWYSAPRYIGIGIRLKNSQDYVRAIKQAAPIGYAAGLGDGSPEPPVIPVPLGHYLYYQFQIPRKVEAVGRVLILWDEVSFDNPNLTDLDVGVGAQGIKVKFDFDDAPHALVAGMTDSGKSELVRTILCALTRTYTPNELGIIIADPKRDYEDFYQQEHQLTQLCHTSVDIAKAICYANDVLEQRIRKNLRDERRLLLVIDEADQQNVLGDRDNLVRVLNISNQGRSFKVNLLVATHKPDAASIGAVKDELDNRFLGKQATAAVSGQLGAGLNLHRLTSRGDFIHIARGRSFRFLAALTPRTYTATLNKAQNLSPLPDLPGQSPATIPKNPSHRPRIEPDLRGLAWYHYNGPENISAKMADEYLNYKETAHRRTQQAAKRFQQYLDQLKQGEGTYPDKLMEEIDV